MSCDNIITALSGIIGVIIGGFIASFGAQRIEHKKLLAETYGDVITAYAHWIEDNSPETIRLLAAATERARLFCPDKTGKLLRELAQSVIHGDNALNDSFDTFYRFADLAREDVRKHLW